MRYFFLFTVCAWAQIDQPQLGKMLDAKGAVRTVYGIASSVSLGEAEMSGVLSSACAKNLCLAKTSASIVSASGSVEAPAGQALFAFEGDRAYIWFSESRQLAQWNNNTLTFLDTAIDGEVLSLRGSKEFAVRRPNGVWIVKSDGGVIASLPGAAGPVMLLADSAVYATRNEIVIRDVSIPLDRVTSFTRMSAGYLQVRAHGVDYALRIEKGREALFQLPAVATGSQLALYAVTGSTEVSVGATYPFGQVALGATSNVQFQIYNSGASPVTITSVTLGGEGFSFEYSLQQLPATLPAHTTLTQALNIWVSFTPTSTATFNANLSLNSSSGGISTILIGSGVTAPTLTSGAGCTSSVPFNWGSVSVNNSSSCTFNLQNLNPQAVTVPSIVVNGLGFTGPYGVTAPFTLQPGQSASFSVNFTPPAAVAYSGTLAIGTQSYGLSGLGQQALLPTPVLQFDSASYASAQQGVLTVTIPGASPVAATGYINLTFTPSTAAVTDDSEIVFLANGSRTIPFSVAAGATTVLLNGQTSAAFQTGTTEGTITFSLTTAVAMTGAAPVQKFTIGGAKVSIDSTSANKERTGYLDITIIGADNTYSIGMMSFSFFDTSGNAIASAVSADFTSSFKKYYGGDTSGSAFQALVSFPVTGSVATIGSVTVTLTNAAGSVSTGSLTFQ
jgi:hypothetical protein